MVGSLNCRLGAVLQGLSERQVEHVLRSAGHSCGRHCRRLALLVPFLAKQGSYDAASVLAPPPRV